MSEPQYEAIHIVPIGDSRDHVASEACWCSPEEDPDDNEYGLAPVFIHNSADGREAFEQGLRKPS